MPRAELGIAEIIKIIRKIQAPEIVAAFTGAKCPHCGKERKVVKGKHVMPKKICDDECLEAVIENDSPFILTVAKEFAIKKDLPNGQTIHYLNDDYRNNNLLFWDKQNSKIVYPFTEIDDYGSVPPIFPVGDGYFNPNDWIDEVDHNTFVFPSMPLIIEMKNWAHANPGKKSMIVTINEVNYKVVYNDEEMKNQWQSCILDVTGVGRLEVHPGDPKWRREIVED